MKIVPLTFAVMMLTATAAQAFTFENKSSDDGAVNALAPGVKPYGDPADAIAPKKDFDSASSTAQQDGVTFQSGRERSFNERYNFNSYFDSNRR
jgi:hypothetical protein